MLNKEIPFLRIGLPVCAGIITGLYFKPDTLFLSSAAITICAGFCASVYFNRHKANLVFGVTLTVSLFVCGLLLYNIEKSKLSDLDPVAGEFLCTLSEFPEEKENSYRFIVKLNMKISPGSPAPLNGSMLIYGRKDPGIEEFMPGDQLIIKCIPKRIENRGNPGEFDYRFYMENRGIRHFAFAGNNDIFWHSVPAKRKLIHHALITRKKIIGMYKERGVTGERLAVVAAITLGQKNMLDPDQKQSFINAGVIHIMAVSGLHAMILSLFVYNLFFFLGSRFKILRVMLTILFLWSFAFVTGLTPSVLRATLMCMFLQTGNLMKRRVNSINSLLASAFVLILIRPSVIFEAGFLLSYSAVIFIICFYRDLYLKLDFKKWLPDKIWQAASVTLVAQAGTLPLTVTLFNRFPVYFIITNILIVPLSSLTIITGCLVILTFPVRFISQPLASLLLHLTGLTEILAKKASSLPFSTIENIGMTTPECIFLFCTIFLSALLLLKKQSLSVHYPLIFLIMFLLAGAVKDVYNKTSNEIIIYNSIGCNNTGIRTGHVLNLYSDSDTIKAEVLRHCARSGLRLKVNRKSASDIYSLMVGDKDILISNYLNEYLLQKLDPDYIILKTGYPRIDGTIDSIAPVEALIMSSVVAQDFKLPDCLTGIDCDTIHSVKESGAFIRKIRTD